MPEHVSVCGMCTQTPTRGVKTKTSSIAELCDMEEQQGPESLLIMDVMARLWFLAFGFGRWLINFNSPANSFQTQSQNKNKSSSPKLSVLYF